MNACQKTPTDGIIPDASLVFYLCYSFYRMAQILQVLVRVKIVYRIVYGYRIENLQVFIIMYFIHCKQNDSDDSSLETCRCLCVCARARVCVCSSSPCGNFT